MRLKRAGNNGRRRTRTDFNTKKVRLKLKEQITFRFDDENFNTKKVRLKHADNVAWERAFDAFQYQKGAIKTGFEPIVSRELF